MKLSNETKVGLLAAVVLGLLLLGINLGKAGEYFQNKFVLKAYYDDANGLGNGNMVMLQGLEIGRVEDIQMDPQNGRIEVLFSIDEKIKVPIDSWANISSADLLGSKAILIEPGSSPILAQSGETLAGKISKSLEQTVLDEVLPFQEDIQGLISQMDRFMEWIGQAVGETNGESIDRIQQDFSVAAKQINRATSRFDTLKGSINQTSNTATDLADNIKGQEAALSRILDSLTAITDALDGSSNSVQNISDGTDDLIKDVKHLVSEIKEGDGSISKMMRDEKWLNQVKGFRPRMDSLFEDVQNGDIKIKNRVRFRDKGQGT